MWLLAANVMLSFILAWTVGAGAKVPADLDSRLQPRGRVSPTGFPCVELHLATVLAVAALLHYPRNGWVWVAGVGGIWCLIFLRLYGLSHFPHQLGASVALGLAGVPLLMFASNRAFPKGVPIDVHILGGVFIATAFLTSVAYKIEQGDSPVLRVAKKDCEYYWERVVYCFEQCMSQPVFAHVVTAADATLLSAHSRSCRLEGAQPSGGSEHSAGRRRAE